MSDTAPERWLGELEQVLVRGTRWIAEVAFFHRSSKTLILVDLLANMTDATPNINWQLKTLVEVGVPYVEQPETGAGVSAPLG